MRQTAATAFFFRDFPYKTAAKTTIMNPKRKHTQNPEGSQGESHHPNTIDKPEPHIAKAMFGEQT